MVLYVIVVHHTMKIAVFFIFLSTLLFYATIEASFRSGQMKVNKNINLIIDKKGIGKNYEK